MPKIIILFLSLSIIGSCANFGLNQKRKYTKEEQTEQMICLAGLATVLGWKIPKMGRFIRNDKENNMIFVRKGGAGKLKCYITDKEVVWGNVNGRWRTHPSDSKVTYILKNKEIVIADSFSDGSINGKMFTMKELKPYVK